MLILAVDSSYKNGSVSLLRGEKMLGSAQVEGGLFSAQLVPRIAHLLEQHGISKAELEAYAVAAGPGSFTGLRIGLAAIKGLAEVLPRPIAAVSVLEAIAFAGKIACSSQNLIAAMDASRHEVYLGGFRLCDGVLSKIAETLCKEEDLANALAERAGAEVITPEEHIASLASAAGASVHLISWPGSEAIGQLGYQKLQRGEVVALDELDANYVRGDDNLFFRSGARPQ